MQGSQTFSNQRIVPVAAGPQTADGSMGLVQGHTGMDGARRRSAKSQFCDLKIASAFFPGIKAGLRYRIFYWKQYFIQLNNLRFSSTSFHK